MKGFTLAELLIGMALGTVVLLITGSLFLRQHAYTQSSQRKADDEALLRPLTDQLEADLVAARDVKGTSLTTAEPRLVLQVPHLSPTAAIVLGRITYQVMADTTDCPAGQTCKKLVRQSLSAGNFTDPETVLSSQAFGGFKDIRLCISPGTSFAVPALTVPGSDCAFIKAKFPAYFANGGSVKVLLTYIAFNSLVAGAAQEIIVINDFSNKVNCFDEFAGPPLQTLDSPNPYYVGR